jgi:thiamine biosynthesis lipoprotein
MIARRRVLTVLGGAAALAISPAEAAEAADRGLRLSRWRGVALGAPALIALAHPHADRLLAAARAEIARLEAVFSLHRPDSALARLNREGRLAAPPADLVALLALARAVHRDSDGAFDPSVQPLWDLHARAHAAGAPPPGRDVDAARRLLGFEAVRVEPDLVALPRPGMALTLNGVAQGWIADRVAALLAAEGLTGALVHAGEIRALGPDPDGRPWRVALRDGAGAPAGATALASGGLATSAPLGTAFDQAGAAGHILDPRSGRPLGAGPALSVAAPTAALADALSTAGCAMAPAAFARLLDGRPGVRLARAG